MLGVQQLGPPPDLTPAVLMAQQLSVAQNWQQLHELQSRGAATTPVLAAPALGGHPLPQVCVCVRARACVGVWCMPTLALYQFLRMCMRRLSEMHACPDCFCLMYTVTLQVSLYNHRDLCMLQAWCAHSINWYILLSINLVYWSAWLVWWPSWNSYLPCKWPWLAFHGMGNNPKCCWSVEHIYITCLVFTLNVCFYTYTLCYTLWIHCLCGCMLL